MEFFNPKANVNFMGIRKWSTLVSILLFFISVFIVFSKGLNLGLDFTGGMQLQLHYEEAAPLNEIRAQLDRAHFDEARVQSYGSSQDILISLATKHLATDAQAEKEAQQKIAEEVSQALPGAQLRSVEYIGPQVGKELATKGFLAVITALLATMVYVALRFEWRLALSSVFALVHDPMIILGIFTLFQIPFDLVTLSAVLAVIGYSLNDTIVVFDRIRENFRRVRQKTPVEIVNLSVNQTLSRTIMTSALTMIVVVSMLIFGGPTLRGFSIALIIGIVVGTYSSIYVAGALALMIGIKREDLMVRRKIEIEEAP